MNRDPFYCEIIDRLNSTLDPDLFEQCAADLLRTIYPGLTPMRGGSDSGMDGAIADGGGEPFPLIATTNKNVIGNFTRNLTTYVRNNGRRRKVVLATSRFLTPKRKINLFTRAGEHGFTLVNIHDRDAFANLLYRSPEWCRELLNLSSTPPPFSKIPRSERPVFNAPLIGRQDSLEWLRQTTRDRLLVGQPGSGKTFLLQQIAQEDRGLFLVTRDRGEIADGIRSQQPTVIFVDDAAPDLDLLVTLRHMRDRTGENFSIIATGWPGHETAISQTLDLANNRIHRLEPLTREEIKQVVYGVGVGGPNQLVREIVNQAEGRPGLATTLALLWLRGDRQEVVSGDKLTDTVLNFAQQFISEEAAQILAILSLSGDVGLSLSAVEELTRLRQIEVQHVLNQLTDSGFVMIVGEQRLTVRPPALRYVLVRNVFFRDVRLPIERILARVPSRSEAARVLIGARARGADVSDNLLRPLVTASSSTEVWEAYAGLGREEAQWLLRNHPHRLTAIAEPGLFRVPEAFIPALLTAAVGDLRPLQQFSDHPLRQIEEWIEAARPGTGQAFHRRRLLLDATETWLRRDHDWRVGGRALQLVLSPRFHYVVVDPGQGHYIEWTDGVLSPHELNQIQNLWPRVLNLISGIHVTDWSIIHEMVERWVYRSRIRSDLPDQVRDIMHAFAVQMLQDVVPLVGRHPATQRWVRRTARRLGAEIVVAINTDFEILYPSREDEEDFDGAEERELAAVSALAERWSGDVPELVARNMAEIEAEAKSVGLTYPCWTPALCREIARRVLSPVDWARALINANLSGNLILPFLQRGAEANAEGWVAVALECLDLPEIRNAAVAVALTIPDPPDEFLERALGQLDDAVGRVKWECSAGRVPEHRLRLLLSHTSSAVASAAAEGEWNTEPRGTIRETVREDWEQAVIRSSSDHYWLSNAFRDNPDLAYRWLANHLTDQEGFETYHPASERVIQTAVSALTLEQRLDLLSRIPDHYGFGMLVVNLVRGGLDLYRELLHDESLERYHCAPLAGVPEGEWLGKAILAYDAGYSPEDIVHATVFGHPAGMTLAGPWSECCSEWVERFERLCSHPDRRIQEVGHAGRSWAIRQRDDAQRRERREAVHGTLR